MKYILNIVKVDNENEQYLSNIPNTLPIVTQCNGILCNIQNLNTNDIRYNNPKVINDVPPRYATQGRCKPM